MRQEIIIMDEAFENSASVIMPIFFDIVFRNYRNLKEIQLLEKELTQCEKSKALPDHIKDIIDRLINLNINPNIKKILIINIEKWLVEQDEIRETYNKTNYEIKYWPNPTSENRSIYNTNPIKDSWSWSITRSPRQRARSPCGRGRGRSSAS